MKTVSVFLIVLFVVSFILTFVSPAAQYNPEVYRVQKALKEKGYDPGPLDGQWGRSTRNAVEQFQRVSDLSITGRLDDRTKAKLGIQSSDRGVKAVRRADERRLALVSGNGAYQSAPLKNPVNDANDMSIALRGLGFEVDKRTNVSQEEMEDAIYSFSQRLKKGDVGLFYFSGHGVQVRGRNYLIPVGETIRAERDVKYKAVDAGLITDGMYDAGNGLNIVLLDACRDNPFSRSFRTGNQGLARMDASTGTFVAYATAPGAVAADGTGRNGIFTKHLLKNLNKPGLKIEDVLKRVRIGVMQETGNKQVPWQASSLTGDFYFASSGAVVDKPAPGASPSVESNIPGAEVPDPFDEKKKLAEKGDTIIQLDLGWRYYKGKGVPQDYKQAFYWFTKAAAKGHAHAQNNLGLMYSEGKGVPQDYKQAAYWYTKAAEQGLALAQIILGLMYDKGKGVLQNYKQAFYWITKAAEQGLAGAQNHLGRMYTEGKGVPQNYKQAFYWFTKAAAQGHAHAQHNLGEMYYFGKGVQDYILAYVWSSLAASAGDEDARRIRDLIAKKLTPQSLAEAQELAAKLQYKITQQNN